MSRAGVQCPTCKYYIGQFTCFAFPNGIPDKVLTDEISHKTHIEGDHNIVWKSVSKGKK